MVLSGEIFPIVAFATLSAALTGVLCCFATSLGKATRLIDVPDGVRKTHPAQTPLVGGLALLLPSFASSLSYGVNFAHMPFIIVAIVTSTMMLLVGIADDRAGLSPVWRFAALIFIIFVSFSVNPLFVIHTLRLGGFGYHIAFSLDPLAGPITALMIVGFVNAANMADGMNGQLLGSVAIWSVLIACYLGLDAALPFIAVSCSAVVTMGFNLRGRLFSGSSGAYAAALFISLGAIAAYRLSNRHMSADLPLVWFWLPVADCVRLIVRRLLRGRSPFAGDRNHIHHILMEYMTQRRALIVYLVMLGAPGVGVAINETLGITMFLMALSAYVMLVFLHESTLARARVERTRNQPATDSNSAPAALIEN